MSLNKQHFRLYSVKVLPLSARRPAKHQVNSTCSIKHRFATSVISFTHAFSLPIRSSSLQHCSIFLLQWTGSPQTDHDVATDAAWSCLATPENSPLWAVQWTGAELTLRTINLMDLRVCILFCVCQHNRLSDRGQVLWRVWQRRETPA